MKFEIKKFDKFIYGFVPGLLLPALFIYVYIERFYTGEGNPFEVIKLLYPSTLLGKLVLLSVLPDLMFVFLFYKRDTFKLAVGCMVGAVFYIIVATFLL
jgi:hypothetical protein